MWGYVLLLLLYLLRRCHFLWGLCIQYIGNLLLIGYEILLDNAKNSDGQIRIHLPFQRSPVGFALFQHLQHCISGAQIQI
jgi:hypothetical protein